MEVLNTKLKDGTKNKMKELLNNADCKDMTEFVQKSIDYYSAYLLAKENENILSKEIQKSISSAVALSESNIRKLMYKQAVQVGMINSVLMLQVGLTPTEVTRLKGKVINDLNQTLGSIEMENIAYELEAQMKMESVEGDSQ